jgi:hypothetical protein
MAKRLDKNHVLTLPYSDKVRALIREIKETFRDIHPDSLQTWEQDFSRDVDGGFIEISTWLCMSDMFKHFTAGRDLNPEQRSDVYQVLSAFGSVARDHALENINAKTIPQSRVRAMVEYLAAEMPAGMERARARVEAARGGRPD